MNAEQARYPQPHVDSINREFIDGWHDGHIVLQHCSRCGLVNFYPRPMCPQCWSTELEFRRSDGRGVLVAFSVIHRPNHPSFFDEIPIVLGEVCLAEGATMIARVICNDPSQLQSGVRLESVPLEEARRFPLPTFRISI